MSRAYNPGGADLRLIKSDRSLRFDQWSKRPVPVFALRHVIPEWRLKETEEQEDNMRALKAAMAAAELETIGHNM